MSGDGTLHAAIAGVWALSFGALGVGLAAASQSMGYGADLRGPGFAAGVAGAILGFAAFHVETRRAMARPAVAGPGGRTASPPRAWLWSVPLYAGISGLSLLTLVVAFTGGSHVAPFALLVVAAAAWSLGRAIRTREELVLALEEEAAGRPTDAKARWESLQRASWVTLSGRDQSALNLGLLALKRGALGEAASWYSRVRAPRVLPYALAGLALVKVLQGAHAEAEKLLNRASTASRATQAEVDGIRLLLLLRREGARQASEVGRRLLAPDNGLLFLGVLASARRATGDEAGAREILDRGLAAAIRASGLAPAVQELARLVEEPAATP